jgi:hypothetical protein
MVGFSFLPPELRAIKMPSASTNKAPMRSNSTKPKSLEQIPRIEYCPVPQIFEPPPGGDNVEVYGLVEFGIWARALRTRKGTA